MSQQQVHITVNVTNLMNRYTSLDAWEERAIDVMDSAPDHIRAQVRRLLQLSEVTVSFAEADAIKLWFASVPGWSEGYLKFTRVSDASFSVIE